VRRGAPTVNKMNTLIASRTAACTLAVALPRRRRDCFGVAAIALKPPISV